MEPIKKQVILLNLLALAISSFQLVEGYFARYLAGIVIIKHFLWVVPNLIMLVVLLILVASTALCSNRKTRNVVASKAWFIMPILLSLTEISRELIGVFSYTLIMYW